MALCSNPASSLQPYVSFIGVGCCDFQFQTKDAAIIHGRSTEYPIETKSKIFVINRNTEFHSFGPDGTKTVSWESKYGYVGIDVNIDPLSVGKPIEGVNTEGLSVSALSLEATQYATINENNKSRALAVLDLGDYLLGNCGTVDEALEALAKVEVWCPLIPGINQTPGVHLALHDAFGNNYVVEFLKGKTKCYPNPIGILTNDPPFKYHIQNLRNYIGNSPNPVRDINYRGVELKNVGPGSGMSLPGGLDPVSRFVRLSNLIQTATVAETALKGINLAFHHLNAMDKPEGCCNADFVGHMLSDHTRWTVVMDLTNPKLYFRTYEDLEIDVIDLKRLSFEKGTEHKTISLAGKVQTFKDVTELL